MGKIYSEAREARKQVFLDTKQKYENDGTLMAAVKSSIERQRVILEAAKAYADYKVCVHNFASATKPGRGVENGSSA